MKSDYENAVEAINKLDKRDIKFLVFNMLVGEKLKFEEISDLYVSYLELMKKHAKSRESLFNSCLQSSVSGMVKDNEPFFHSQMYVLMEKWTDDGWLDKHLNQRTEELIEKNRGFLK